MLDKGDLTPFSVTHARIEELACEYSSAELQELADLMRSVSSQQLQEIKDVLSMFLLRDAFSCVFVNDNFDHIP